MTLQACNSSSSYRLAQHLYYPDLGKHQLPEGRERGRGRREEGREKERRERRGRGREEGEGERGGGGGERIRVQRVMLHS